MNDDLFWLEPGALCGRSGPNRLPWTPSTFPGLGIGGVLSVNDGESVYEDELTPHGLRYACIPLARNAPPEPGDLELCLEQLPRAFDFTTEIIASNRAVLVHCRQGKDRTGLFMAYYLLRQRALSIEAAIDAVLAVRPQALSATGWQTFGRQVLERC